MSLTGKVVQPLVGMLRYELDRHVRAAESAQPGYMHLTGKVARYIVENLRYELSNYITAIGEYAS